MNPKELTTGSYVQYGDKITQVHELNNTHCVLQGIDGEISIDFVDPIAVTRDNIEQFGFVKKREHCVVDPKTFQRIPDVEPEAIIYHIPGLKVEMTFFKKAVELRVYGPGSHIVKLDGVLFVHQIQNAMILCDIKEELCWKRSSN